MDKNVNDGYFKLQIPVYELMEFISTIKDAFKNPGKKIKLVEGYIMFNGDLKNPNLDKDEFIFEIPPEFIGIVSEAVMHACDEPTITQDMILSKITLVE